MRSRERSKRKQTIMKNLHLVPVLECAYAGAMLPDYWGGHHLAHVSFPVTPGMSMQDIKLALHSEVNQCAIAGNDDRTRDDSGGFDDGGAYWGHGKPLWCAIATIDSVPIMRQFVRADTRQAACVLLEIEPDTLKKPLRA